MKETRCVAPLGCLVVTRGVYSGSNHPERIAAHELAGPHIWGVLHIGLLSLDPHQASWRRLGVVVYGALASAPSGLFPEHKLESNVCLGFQALNFRWSRNVYYIVPALGWVRTSTVPSNIDLKSWVQSVVGPGSVGGTWLWNFSVINTTVPHVASSLLVCTSRNMPIFPRLWISVPKNGHV